MLRSCIVVSSCLRCLRCWVVEEESWWNNYECICCLTWWTWWCDDVSYMMNFDNVFYMMNFDDVFYMMNFDDVSIHDYDELFEIISVDEYDELWWVALWLYLLKIMWLIDVLSC